MNILDHYKQSHDLRTSQDYEVSINDQGAGLGAPAPVEGRFFYPEGDAPRPQYEGDMLERTGQALEDVGQTAKSMAVGAGAGMAGLPGDVVALTGGLARLLFPGDEGRIQGATDTITKISEAIGSERFLGLYRDLVNESDMSAEDKQMALDAAETGSFFSLPGAVPVAQAAKRGAKAFAAGAPARVAERQSGTTLASGVDPTAMIDDIITAQARYFETGKFEPPTAENPVSVVKPTEQEPGIIAFHGSGADFDEFRLEMIGTGEGAQAYGYGLYFTDSEDIAKFYKDTVSTGAAKIPYGSAEDAAQAIPESLLYLDIDGYRSYLMGDAEEMIASVLTKQYFNVEPEQRIIDANLDVFERDGVLNIKMRDGSLVTLLRDQNGDRFTATPIKEKTGKMYKVGLSPKPDDLLDYDLPLSQQSKAVKEKAIDVLKQIYPNVDNPALTMRGSDLIGQVETSIRVKTQEQLDIIDIKLKELQKIMDADTPPGVTNIGTIRQFVSKKGEDAAKEYDSLVEQSKRLPIANFNKPASELLAQAGIPGIKYRAAGSRGAATADEAAERNYVIFDDKAVKILEKYGIVGPVAVTAGAASQTDTEADDGKIS